MATRISQEQLNKFINPEAAMAPYERAEKQRAQQSEQDAALAQLIKGQELKDASVVAERDRNLRDLIKLRETAGPDARVTSGDIGYDPRTDVAGRGAPPKPTVFQETLDRETAKDVAEDMSKGGAVKRTSQIAELGEIASNLDRASKGGALSSNLSGPYAGVIPRSLVPDKIRATLDPKSMKTQQQFELIAQESLKETLGGQFAQQEAREFFSRAYNPDLPPAMLAERVRMAAKVRQLISDEKAALSAYAQQTGSLRGYPSEQRDRELAQKINSIRQAMGSEAGASAQPKSRREEDPEFDAFLRSRGL